MKSKIGNRAAFKRSVATLACAFVASTPLLSSHAADPTPSTDELVQRINSLEQQLKDLKAQLEQNPQAAAAPAKPTAIVSAGADGFSFQSADSNFVLTLHGHLQADSRTFNSDGHAKGNDQFLLRRARPILAGTVYRDFDFLFTPDFAGNDVANNNTTNSTQILDAYVNYHPLQEVQLQIGKFKSPVGLEVLQGDQYLTFNERSLVTDLAPNRDIGAELHGDLFGGAASYAAGLFNGAPDYAGTTENNNFDNDKAVAGRLFFQPFRNTSIAPLQGFGAGVGGSYGLADGAGAKLTGLTTAGYLTDGQQTMFAYTNTAFAQGVQWRLSPQGYYYWGPLSLMGEYMVDSTHVVNGAAKPVKADLENTAWEIQGGYVLTGEAASYANGVTPVHSFDPLQGRWGAVQLVARYEDLNLDKETFPAFADATKYASGAHAWSLGVNWYLNRIIRLNASYAYTTFDGVTGKTSSTAVDKRPEEVFFTRVQVAF
ncbi:MAG: porin [Verrucomicrobiota bacterium]|jgi:phosphate-selective porin OprO/OprP